MPGGEGEFSSVTKIGADDDRSFSPTVAASFLRPSIGEEGNEAGTFGDTTLGEDACNGGGSDNGGSGWDIGGKTGSCGMDGVSLSGLFDGF